MKNSTTTIYLVRHGQSGHNAGTHDQERHPLGSHLTELGREQAKKIAKELKDVGFERIISTDLARTKQTAEIILAEWEKDLPIEETTQLRERYYGEVSYDEKRRRQEQIRTIIHNKSSLSEAEKHTLKFEKEIESGEEMISRIVTFLKKTAQTYPGEKVIAITHGEVIRFLAIHFNIATYEEVPAGTIENTAYMILETNGEDISVKQVQGLRKKTIAHEE